MKTDVAFTEDNGGRNNIIVKASPLQLKHKNKKKSIEIITMGPRPLFAPTFG